MLLRVLYVCKAISRDFISVAVVLFFSLTLTSFTGDLLTLTLDAVYFWLSCFKVRPQHVKMNPCWLRLSAYSLASAE